MTCLTSCCIFNFTASDYPFVSSTLQLLITPYLQLFYSTGHDPDDQTGVAPCSLYCGDNTLAHIPDRRLHDCAQFTCILVLRLRTLPFQYTCKTYYVCAHLKLYTSSEQYFLHLYLYDLHRTGEYYLIYIIHSEIKF